jgi:antitoxin component of RelBE/YafQ-DinJ toxin-antitoxin module
MLLNFEIGLHGGIKQKLESHAKFCGLTIEEYCRMVLSKYVNENFNLSSSYEENLEKEKERNEKKIKNEKREDDAYNATMKMLEKGFEIGDEYLAMMRKKNETAK